MMPVRDYQWTNRASRNNHTKSDAQQFTANTASMQPVYKVCVIVRPAGKVGTVKYVVSEIGYMPVDQKLPSL